jgi:hypothetical protein
MLWDYRVGTSLALFAAAGLFAGCNPNGIHPVKGQVVWKDTGQPATEIAGSIITFEQAATETSARGQIAADGSFKLTTVNENDGAKLGEHKVLVIEIGRRSLPGGDGSELAPGKLSSKHASPSTTGITAVIKPGLNEPKIEVERFMP